MLNPVFVARREKAQEIAGEFHQLVRRHVAIGETGEIADARLKPVVFRLDDVDQIAARDAEALGDHGARLAVGDQRGLKRGELFIRRFPALKGDRRLALDFEPDAIFFGLLALGEVFAREIERCARRRRKDHRKD